MSFNLAAYKSQTKPVTATLDDATFQVTYRPAAFTPALESEMRTGEAEGKEQLVAMLATLVADSDVLDGEVPLAWTEASLAQQPYTFLRAALDAIVKDLQPGEVKNDSSFGG